MRRSFADSSSRSLSPWAARVCFLLLSFTLFASHATAKYPDTVYVNNVQCTGGPGRSPDSAFCSIQSALDNFTFSSYTVLAVMGAGKPYREQVLIESGDSGSSESPFVLFARGDVTISGADTTTQWSADQNLWRAEVVGPRAPHQVYVLGTRYPEDLTSPSLPVGRCRYVSGGDSVYINTGGPDPRSEAAYISNDTPIELDGVSYVNIIGFKIRYSNDDGITGAGWNECVIANCDVRYSWRQGIMFAGSNHVVVRDNICNDNGSHGIYLVDSDSSCVVLRNTASGNDDPRLARGGVNGIRIGSRSDTLTAPFITHEDTVEANRTFKNEDSGIEIRHNYVLSRYNQSWDNHDHGFDHLSCTNVTHMGDLSWGNWRDGMSFENGSHQHTVKNCVIANNGRDPCRNDWEMEFDNSALYNLQSDYNVIWRPSYAAEPGDTILINLRGGPQGGDCGNGNCTSHADSCFGTLARFQQAFTSLEQNSKAAQPTFVDTAAGDFKPLSSSSVIDAADTTVAGWTTRDVRGFVRHDYAAVSNTGNPAGTYRDIGPYEFDAPPGAPTLTPVSFGNQSIAAYWTNSGDDGGVGTASEYQLLTSTGAPGDPETSQCDQVSGLGCAYIQVHVVVTEQDNGQTAVSNIIAGSTKCSGGYAACGDRPGSGPNAAVLHEEDFPLDLGPTRPNPSPGTSTLFWSIPRAKEGAPYDVSLFDVAGRRVSTLAKGTAKAGKVAQVVTFRSPSGRPVGDGVYFLRLRVDDQLIRQKVVVVR